MRKLFFILVFFQAAIGLCTDIADDKVIHGKLENGLTYYIRENGYPQQKALLQLVVKVGSIYEQDEEKGVAHFLEHLVFRGTKHFQDGEIFKYLESIGCWAGADVNAYTAFDSTVYHLDIPLDKPQSLQTALTILTDIAAYATLSDSSLEKERNVVLDELHQDFSSPTSKITKKIFTHFLPNSPYVDHFPIGLEKVVKSVSPDTVRNFYKRWYRPDRMAIIAIGDFDGQDIKKQIGDSFGQIPCSKEKVIEPVMDVTYHTDQKAVIHFDPEIPSTEIALFSFYPSIKNPSEEEIKNNLLDSIVTLLLDNRLSKLAHESANFLGTDSNEGTFIGDTDYSYIEAELFENNYKEGLKILNNEIQKIVKSGFTPSECQKLKTQWQNSFKRGSSNDDKTEHQDHISDYLEHFLYNTPILSEEWLDAFVTDYIENLSVEEINAYIPSSHLADSFMILLCTSSEDVKEKISEEELIAIFNEEASISSTNKDSSLQSFECPSKFPAGEILSVKTDDLVSEMLLSNGIRIQLKATDLENGRVYLFAHAKGGISSYTKEKLASAHLALDYALLSGLGGLSYLELIDFFENSDINCHLRFGTGMRSIYVSAPQEELEAVFQLFHAFFTEPQFDLKEWERLKTKTAEQTKQHKKDPDLSFRRFVSRKNAQDYYYFKSNSLDDAHEETARNIFAEAFGRAQDFTFFVVGDFDSDEVADLSSEYLASLPMKEKTTFPSLQIPSLFPSMVVNEEFYKGHKTYATNVITIPHDYKSFATQFGNVYLLQAVTKILQQRLHEILRIRLGNTYGVSVIPIEPFYPDFAHSQIQIEFTCQPEHRKMMTDLVLSEIENMKISLPSEQETATVRTLFLESKKEDARYNSFWINALHASDFTGLSLNSQIDYKTIIETLSPELIQEAAQMIFASPNYSILTHLPED